MAGGYRQGSGRSKSGYYKGIYCGSTYELCWVIYSIDHNIKFDRFPGCLEKDGIKYYPDFLLDDGNTIIETKGYEKSDSVERKTKVAEFYGYKVIVLRKEDLYYAFEYVTAVYDTKLYYTLYDEYKPKYNITCDCCNIEFTTDKKRKTKNKFCSRICSGKYRKISNVNQPGWKQRVSNALIGKTPTKYIRKNKQIWITNNLVNTRISENLAIPEGFHRGRS